MVKSKQVRFYFHQVVNNGQTIDLSEVFDEVSRYIEKNQM